MAESNFMVLVSPLLFTSIEFGELKVPRPSTISIFLFFAIAFNPDVSLLIIDSVQLRTDFASGLPDPSSIPCSFISSISDFTLLI